MSNTLPDSYLEYPKRRYGMDYDVVEARSARTGSAELERLRDAGVDVAVIAANAHLIGDCTTFLAGTRDAFPRARRLVLSMLGDNWVLPSIAHAAALGEIDVFDYLPTSDRDERFLSGIASILVDWAQEVPAANNRAISTQQQPMQKSPCCSPRVNAPDTPSRQCSLRKCSGDRQCVRQECFHGSH